MKKKNLKVNMILNGIRNALNIIFPLITFPYVSRVLGVDKIGTYNFAESIISYLILLAGLGINTYAIREGARIRNSKEKFEKFSRQLFSINVISTIFSYMVLTILLFVPKLNSISVILLILSIQVLFRTLGVEWIYVIFEDYLYITIRSIAIQVLSIIALFLFVHNQGDLVAYSIIIAAGHTLTGILNFFTAKKYCSLAMTTDIDLKKHIKPILVLFASQIAIVIYVSSDITILGFLKDSYRVGIYSVSVKIYTIVKTFLASVIVVGIPRLANILGTNDEDEFKKVANDIFNTILTIAIPSILGIILLRHEIIELIAGPDYVESSSSLLLLAIAVICYLGAYFWGQCILVPNREEKKVLYITIISAIINIVLNFVLIPKYNENAAAVTTILAEGFAFIGCCYLGRKYLKMNNMFFPLLKIIIGCFPICMIYYCLTLFTDSSLIRIVLTGLLSVIAYFIIEWLLKNPSIYFRKNKAQI